MLIIHVKWYADPLYVKTKPLVVATRKFVHPQLHVDLDDDKPEVPTHILS